MTCLIVPHSDMVIILTQVNPILFEGRLILNELGALFRFPHSDGMHVGVPLGNTCAYV